MARQVEYDPVKPCPFCGKLPEIHHDAIWRKGLETRTDWYVECNNIDCPVQPSTGCMAGAKSAIDAWNERSE